jgi:hypothetical protein
MLFNKFYEAGASGYEQTFGRVSRDLVPSLMQAARITTGQRVLESPLGPASLLKLSPRLSGPPGM